MIIDKARELGLAICQSDEYLNMQATQSAIKANEALTAALNEYKDKQTMLIDLLQNDENPDKLLLSSLSRDMDSLQAQLSENAMFSAYVDAQTRFSELMASINKEISLCIGNIADSSNSSNCSNNCSGCSGCKH